MGKTVFYRKIRLIYTSLHGLTEVTEQIYILKEKKNPFITRLPLMVKEFTTADATRRGISRFSRPCSALWPNYLEIWLVSI